MKIIVDGLAVEYLDDGDGQVLVMLHGWGDNLHTFDALARELSGFRVVRPDLPGFGGSEKPREVWGVAEYAQFVKNFCIKIGIAPNVLIGHSFGGRVVVKSVGESILTPQKVVLIASAGIAQKPTLKNISFMILAKIGKAVTRVPPLSLFRRRIRKKLYAALGSDYFLAGSMSPIFIKVVKEDMLACAAKIRVPTILIWGNEDASTPLWHGQELHRAIPGSRFEVLSGASHFVHREKPAEIAELVRAFL